jgi:hypothetical protein
VPRLTSLAIYECLGSEPYQPGFLSRANSEALAFKFPVPNRTSTSFPLSNCRIHVKLSHVQSWDEVRYLAAAPFGSLILREKDLPPQNRPRNHSRWPQSDWMAKDAATRTANGSQQVPRDQTRPPCYCITAPTS